MTKKVFLGIGVIAAIAVITFAFAIAASGSDGGVIEQNAEGVTVAASAVTSCISYQGRLADSEGEPLSGTYDMTFLLYNVSSGGTFQDTDTHSVEVTEGLFNTDICFSGQYFDGRELWLGIIVEGEEMSPRQEFKPVPYALSLRPGAKIISSGYPALHAESTHPSGRGIRGYATADSGTNFGVVGASKSPDGYGGYFYNNGGGTGVYGKGGKYGGFFTSDQAGTVGSHTSGVNATTTPNYCDAVRARTSGDYSHGVRASAYGDSSDAFHAYTEGHHSEGFYAQTTGRYSKGVWAQTTGDNSDGVYAAVYGDDSDGVHAYSEKGYGVYGKSGSNIGKGVYGECDGGSGSGHGVYGLSPNGTGVAGKSTNFEGVWGVSTNYYGVVGHGRSGMLAVAEHEDGAGIHALGKDSGADIILGGYDDTTVGDDGKIYSDPDYPSSDIYLVANDGVQIDLDNDGDGEDADFEIRDKDNNLIFNVDESGDMYASGTKNAMVATKDYGTRKMYAIESTEVWFEDFGMIQLQDGVAVVKIDPVFAETVNLSVDYHVFFTPVDGWAPIYVANKTSTSFVVRDANDEADITLGYRIVALRLGYEDVRMVQVEPGNEEA